MASIREQIVDEIMELLSADGAPLNVLIHRERTRPIENEQLPAMLIYFNEEDPLPITRQVYKDIAIERQLALIVECRAQGQPPTVSPDEALDPLTVWATQQLVGNLTRVSDGGMVSEVIEGKTVWFSKEGDVQVAAASVLFLVKYRTSRTDPTSQISGGLTS
jgi:hypothetical protein